MADNVTKPIVIWKQLLFWIKASQMGILMDFTNQTLNLWKLQFGFLIKSHNRGMKYI